DVLDTSPKKLSTVPADTPSAGTVFCNHRVMMTTSVNSSVTNQYGLYVPHDPFSPTELSAMAYHRMLRAQFAPYYVDADLLDTATQRANAVRMAAEHIITRDWTATLLTAAWIHNGEQQPEMIKAGT